MDGQVMSGWPGGWADGWLSEQLDGWTRGCTEGQQDRRMDEVGLGHAEPHLPSAAALGPQPRLQPR